MNIVSSGSITVNSQNVNTVSSGSITVGNLTGLGLSSFAISTGSITTNTQNVNTVSSGSITVGNLTGLGLSSFAISTGSIITNTQNVNIISSGSLTVNSQNVNTVSSGSLTVNTQNVNTISSGSLTVNTQNVNTISSGSLTVNSQNVNTVSSGSITVGNLTGLGLSSLTISTGSITTSSIIALGNIGIGCNAPSVRLDVAGSCRFFSTSTSTPISLIAVNNYSGQNLSGSDYTISQLFMGGTSFQDSIQMRISTTGYGDAVRMDFCTVSTSNLSTQETRLSILPFSGNIGIGTTTPSQRLVVNGNTQTNTLIASGVSTTTISSFALATSSIFTTGNVGIGCNAPTTRLDVNGKLKVSFDGAAGITLANTTGGANPCELFFSNGSIGAAVGLQSTSRNFFIWQNGDRLNMDVNGNFGINCNAPNAKLDVNGTGKFNDSLLVNGNATLGSAAGGSAFFTGGYASPHAGKLVFGDGSGWYYRLSTRSGGVTTDLVSFRDNGYVGMGIAIPICPLDVRGSVSYSVSTGYQMNSGGTAPYGGASENLTIHSAGVVWSENKFVASSDQRIKKDIIDINDDEALNNLRLIEPKKYKYIDQNTRGSSQYYGFIAQQISSVFNDAVQERTSFIPNYFNTVSTTIETIENSTYITSFEISNEFISTISNISNNTIQSSINIVNVQFYDHQNKIINATVSTISSNTFTAITNTTDITMFSSTLLLYGSEVSDFLTLNKDYLFTLNLAATQQIDRIQQQHQSTIQSMQSILEQQQSTINYLLSRI